MQVAVLGEINQVPLPLYGALKPPNQSHMKKLIQMFSLNE